MKKYDERETLFSRLGLIEGTKEYIEFYSKNPELKIKDDALRGVSFRRNIKKSERFKDLFLPIPEGNKAIINSVFHTAREYKVNETKQSVNKSFSANIKEITKYYGATEVGIAKLTKDNYYQYLGGISGNVGIHNYNEVNTADYKTAIVFAVLMDKDLMNRAPNFEELLATENGYVQAAIVAARLEMYIKGLGHVAESVNSEYYIAPLVPIAYDAGIGEIGMCNHIVTKKYGNNVRLGAVFTNLEIDYDSPVDFGLQAFCKRCSLCLMNCPSKAITHKVRPVNGRNFYKFDENKCFDVWTKTGTDCGTCIQSCPFTQGVDQEKLKLIKDDPSVIDEMVKEHYEKHGRRNYTKHDLDIVKLEDK